MSSLRDRPRGRQGPRGAMPPPVNARRAIPTLQHHALELARALLPTQRATLVRALAPDVLALGSPYTPASPEEEHVAATLAHPAFGLLLPGAAGHARAYRPTPLGRLVLQAYLLDRVAGEPLGAWPAQERDPAGGRRARGR